MDFLTTYLHEISTATKSPTLSFISKVTVGYFGLKVWIPERKYQISTRKKLKKLSEWNRLDDFQILYIKSCHGCAILQIMSQKCIVKLLVT